MKKMSLLLKRKKMGFREHKGFTLIELLVTVGLSVLFTGVVLAALTASRQLCTSISANQDLQQTANVVMNKIIKGSGETGGIFRLSEAVSYTRTSLSDLSFVGTDGTTRRYFLTNANTELRYSHPVNGSATNELVYKAPAGTTLTLRFWPDVTNISLGIDVGLSKTVNGRTVTGSATTVITIRNHVT